MPRITVTPPAAFTDFVTSALGTDYGHVFDAKTASTADGAGRLGGVAGEYATLHLDNTDSHFAERLSTAVATNNAGAEIEYLPLPEFDPAQKSDQIYEIKSDGSASLRLSYLARYLVRMTPKTKPADVLQAEYQSILYRLTPSTSTNAMALLAHIGFDNVTQMVGPLVQALVKELYPAPEGMAIVDTAVPSLNLSLKGNTLVIELEYNVSQLQLDLRTGVGAPGQLIEDALHFTLSIDASSISDPAAWNGQGISFDQIEINAPADVSAETIIKTLNTFPLQFIAIQQVMSAQLITAGITTDLHSSTGPGGLAARIGTFMGKLQSSILDFTNNIRDLPVLIESLNAILVETAQTNPALAVTLARAFTETAKAFENSGMLKGTLWENPAQPISAIEPYFTRATSPISVATQAAFNQLDLERPDYPATPVHLTAEQSAIVALAFGLGLAGQAAQKELETAATDRAVGAPADKPSEMEKLVADEAPRGDYKIFVTGDNNIAEAKRLLDDIPLMEAGTTIWEIGEQGLALNYNAFAARYPDKAPRFLKDMAQFTGQPVDKTAVIAFGQGYASQIRPRAEVAGKPVVLAAGNSGAIVLNIGETITVAFPTLNYTSPRVRTAEQKPVLSIHLLSNEGNQSSTASRFPVLTKQEALFSGVDIAVYGNDVAFDVNAFVWGEVLSAVRQVYSLSQPTSVDFIDEEGDPVVNRIGSMGSAEALVAYLSSNIRAKANQYFAETSGTTPQLREVLALINAMRATQSLLGKDRKTYHDVLTQIESFLDKTVDPTSRFFVALNNLTKGALQEGSPLAEFSDRLNKAREGGANQLMNLLVYLGEHRNDLTPAMHRLFEAVVYHLPDDWVKAEAILERLKSRDLIEPYVAAEVDVFFSGSDSAQTAGDVMNMIKHFKEGVGNASLPNATGAPFFAYLNAFINSVPENDPLYAFVSHIKSQDRGQLSNSLYVLSLVAKVLPPNAIPHFKNLLAASRGVLSINNDVEPANADMLKGELRTLESALLKAGGEEPSPVLLNVVKTVSKAADQIVFQIAEKQAVQRKLTLLELKAEYKLQPGAEVKVFQLLVPHAVGVLESNIQPVMDFVAVKNKYDGIPVVIRKDAKTRERTIEFVGDSTIYPLGDKMPDSLKPSRGRLNAFLDAIVTPRIDKTAEAHAKALEAVNELKRDVWYQASKEAGFQPQEAPKPTGLSINKRLSSLLVFLFTSEEFIMFEEILSLFL